MSTNTTSKRKDLIVTIVLFSLAIVFAVIASTNAPTITEAPIKCVEDTTLQPDGSCKSQER